MTRSCAVCGASFYSRPADVARGRKYCSWDCYRQVASQRPKLLTVSCASCGRRVQKTAAVVERNARQFCSHACRTQGMVLPPKLKACRRCGTRFDQRKVSTGAKAWAARSARFCSRECYNAFRQERVEARNHASCKQCGVEFQKRTHNKGVFCSRKCQSDSTKRDGPGPLRRRVTSYRGPGWAKLAEAIRQRDAHACRNCHARWEAGTPRFPVDHIRPWRECDTLEEANDPANLVTLCNSCHATKTNTIEKAALAGDRVGLNWWRKFILEDDGVDTQRSFLLGWQNGRRTK